MELLIRGTLYVSNRQFSTIIIRLKGYNQIERLEGLTLRMCSSNTLQTSRKAKAGLGSRGILYSNFCTHPALINHLKLKIQQIYKLFKSIKISLGNKSTSQHRLQHSISTMAATTTVKQMRLLLRSISSYPQMKQSTDSILLAEDQYPDSLDAIFTKLSVIRSWH